jgi:hypothetical protein
MSRKAILKALLGQPASQSERTDLRNWGVIREQSVLRALSAPLKLPIRVRQPLHAAAHRIWLASLDP